MKPRTRVSNAIAFSPLFFLPLCFLPLSPAAAHLTEVSGDIAGTWHIEPNHNPRAGESAQVWVALTQRGGKLVPLEQCDCRLTVYEGDAEGAKPLLQPALEAIAAEGYQGIPGAEVTFPRVGQYRLELIGRPKANATFQPFQLGYTVTVATGGSSPIAIPVPQPHSASARNTDPRNTDPRNTDALNPEAAQPAATQPTTGKALIGLGAIGLTLIAVGIALRQQKAAKS